ncbi:chitobiase/beta-hexosaminidase C-terminal domain-containing protein [Pelotomaculum isophthalicicum JI]|uniref:Chitobiase/beta-hexosaminidase C-terminal domain-containing protein n=1 Tax=Pelotomaculum isophthalicicum JI TaxID=947010 RepID=A0A9X4H2M4_9FIRM|nr:FN3 associated domain-containing protein [Pelotomaculum isophthalicicum]MDF9409021.1 chitobiase/beta-hexosaminidase C-terminal domain-containing protein [Pelotomaculum isophthalicicum JI]
MFKKIGLITFLLVIGLSLLTGCQGQKREVNPASAGRAPESQVNQAAGKAGSGEVVLTVKGSGVEHETKYNLDELKSMTDALAGECYSTVNNWPAKKFFVGKGVLVSQLLRKAGIKDEARTITVTAADGYNATLTREQLDEKRYCFPNLQKGSAEGAREVPAILAWEHQEGASDLSKAVGGNLRLLFGQKGMNDVVTAAYVKDVATIEVSTAPPGRWDVVGAEPAPGKVKRGTGVVLSHPGLDRVKIYYTLDGSTPDIKSLVYNPSATYFQPDLIKPIPVDKPVTIKAIVIGYGKHDSQVATFKYDVE